MKIEDFRIGNLVLSPDGIILPICSLHSDNTLRLQKGDESIGCFSIKEIKPIILTEEWLEKLGLIKKNITEDMPEGLQEPDVDENGSIWYHWVKGLFNLEIQSNGEIWFEVYSHYKHIKYVHELQNLYHALTGEELQTNHI